MLKLVVLLLCIVVAVSAYRAGSDLHVRMQFGAFKEKFSKVYATHEEHEKRFLIFARMYCYFISLYIFLCTFLHR